MKRFRHGRHNLSSTRLNKIYLILLGAIASTGLGCSSGALSIATEPDGAQLFVKPLGGGEFRALDSSPLRRSQSEIRDLVGTDGPVIIKASKEGYEEREVLVSETSVTFDVDVKIRLSESRLVKNQKGFNQMVDSLFETQRLVKVGRLEEALKALDNLQKVEPNLAVIHEMRAGIFYIQKDFRKALDEISLAVKYNPANGESLRLKDYLESTVLARAKTQAPAPAAGNPESPVGGGGP